MASHHTETTPSLYIPEAFNRKSDQALPEINCETLHQLHVAGWQRIGIMVAVIDSAGDILMLTHQERTKNHQDMLGPLGETTQHTNAIEQPMQTLYHGFIEELGISQPEKLDLSIIPRAGWAINQWPRGVEHPGKFSCAISFPVFIADESRDELISSDHNGDEISYATFMETENILDYDESKLRPGVKLWLRQLIELGLTDITNSDLVPVDFRPYPNPRDPRLSRNIDLGNSAWS